MVKETTHLSRQGKGLWCPRPSLDGPYASLPPPAAAPLPTAPRAYQGEKLREKSKQEGKVMGERKREWKVNNLRLS